MKTNVLMKIAVVFMAAFGAYAFSGSNLNSQQYKTFDADIQDCTNLVLVECDVNGDATCRVKIDDKIMTLYDLSCSRSVKHNSDVPFYWPNQ